MTLYFELTSAQGTPSRMVLQPGLQRIKAATGDRYRIYDDVTGRTPPDIVVKRFDSHMIIDGLPGGARVELSDFYASCGVSSPCTLVVDGAGVFPGTPVEISPGSPPLQALTDGSFVVYPSGYSGAPAIAVADSEGFPRVAAYGIGGLAIVALAAAGGGGGGGDDASPPVVVAPTPAPPDPPPSAPPPSEPPPSAPPPPAPPPPAPPPAAPHLASVTAVTDDAPQRTGNVADGGATNDDTPTISGKLSAPLGFGESVQVLRNGTALAAPTVVEGDSWRVTDNEIADGSYTYTARVIEPAGAGPAGSGYSIVVDTTNNKTATVASIDDNVSPTRGEVRDGGSTNDPTPTLSGRLSSALASGEELQVLRNDAVVGSPTPGNGTSWTFTDNLPGNGDYDYTVRVVDAVGNLGRESAVYDLRATGLPRTASVGDADVDTRVAAVTDLSVAPLALADLLQPPASVPGFESAVAFNPAPAGPVASLPAASLEQLLAT